MYIFGEKLKNICEEKGMSQQMLAGKVGITYAAVNQWVNGKRIPKGKTVANVARAMDIPVTSLTGTFPCSKELEDIFNKIEEHISEDIEHENKTDLIPGELGGVSHENEIDALERWNTFLEDTFYSIINFAISNPYPDTAAFYDDSDEDGEGVCHAGRQNLVGDELECITQEMIFAMKSSRTLNIPYDMAEDFSKYIFPAVYKTVAYAVRTELENKYESAEKISLLYNQLNATGQKVALERLTELIQIPSYAASSVDIE